jgi:hypothetical protein
MKGIIANLKEARIDILSSRNSLNRAGGREISVFELDQADDYLVRVLNRLENLEPDPPARVTAGGN